MSDVEADLVIGLRKLAGIEEEKSSFVVRRADVAISVDYTSGSSSFLVLSADYDRVARADVAPGRQAAYRASAKGALSGIRPMAITLRSENDSDRAAKDEAISREHQTGDARFDDVVYIETPTTDAALLDAVLSENVRAAALDLLTLGFDWVVIDDDAGAVKANLSAFGRLRADDAPERICDSFASLLSGLPPVGRLQGEHQTRSALPVFLGVTGGVALVVGAPLGLFGIAGAHECTESSSDGEGQSLKDGCGGPAVLALFAALVGGVVAMVIARMIAKPLVSGHSDSHKRLLAVGLAAFAWFALFAFLATAYFGYASMKV